MNQTLLAAGYDPASATATAPARSTWRLFVIVFFVATVCGLTLVPAVNFWIDPFQFFRRLEQPRFSSTMLRHQLPGIVRNYEYDAVMVGNSVGGNFRPSMFAD